MPDNDFIDDPDPETVDELREALTSDEEGIVDLALLLIGKRNIRELEPEVWKFLESEYSDLRDRAIGALRRMEVPEFRDRAYSMMKDDPDQYVRAAAVNAWSITYYFATKDPQVVATLNAILRDESEETIVRTEALRGLYAVTGTPFFHVNFDRMIRTEDPEKFQKMVPWHEVIAMVEGSSRR